MNYTLGWTVNNQDDLYIGKYTLYLKNISYINDIYLINNIFKICRQMIKIIK